MSNLELVDALLISLSEGWVGSLTMRKKKGPRNRGPFLFEPILQAGLELGAIN